MTFDAVEFDGGWLRPWHAADAAVLVQAWNDPDIARWNQVPDVPTAVVAQRWIAGWQARYDRRLAVDLVVADASSGSIVGEVGLSNFADIPGGGRGVLLGYWLLPQSRGKGLSARAVQASVGWARSELGVSVAAVRCHKDNLASQVVASRAGFEHERDDEAGYQIWFSRPRGG